MNYRTMMVALAMAALCLVTPFLMACSEADVPTDSESQSIHSKAIAIRADMERAGYSSDQYSDEELLEIEERFGWFANKDLMWKCTWDDPSGINWLLEEAGVFGFVDGITLVGDNVSLIIKGVTTVIANSNPLFKLIDAGLFVVDLYADTMAQNALEKANLALELVNQQKNYAVYETWVMWHTVPNGYEVEEW